MIARLLDVLDRAALMARDHFVSLSPTPPTASSISASMETEPHGCTSAAASSSSSSCGSQSSCERLHALDACRASAMLLGIFLHASLAYRPWVGESWPVDDASESAWLAAAVEIIHSFRMQLFFLLSGFFTALLIERRGMRGWIANRAVRIGLPYGLGIVLLSPLCLAAWMYAAGEWRYVNAGVLLREIGSSWHLWFLRELLIFYALTCVMTAIVPRATRLRIANCIARIALHRCGVLGLAFAVWLTLLVQPWWGIHGPGLWPAWQNLLHYGFYFSIGAALWPARAQLAELGGRWLWLAAAGLLVAAPAHQLMWQWYDAHGGFTLQHIAQEPVLAAIAARAAYALMSVTLTLGSLGVFVRYFARPSTAWRYLSDASYWAYLMHFPLVILAARLVSPLARPAIAKVMLILLLVCPALLGSYALFVRPTVIGRMLNGTRAATRTPTERTHAAALQRMSAGRSAHEPSALR